MAQTVAQEECRERMSKALTKLKSDFSTLRTGRASPALLESIKVDYYGTKTPLNQMAQISVPDAKTLQVSCWDQSAVSAVEKAIIAANIGLTPNVDGKLLRLNIPALTEDRRKDIAKSAKKMGEDAKIIVRTVRREVNDSIKEQEKAKSLSEDDSKKLQDEVQKVTDSFVADIDKLVEAKTKEILTL